MSRRTLMMILTLIVSLGALVPLLAQDTLTPVVVADGLNHPRHIAFAPGGTLLVAEAGAGGDVDTTSPFGPAKAGGTASVTRIEAGGARSRVLNSLPSIDWLNGEVLGAHAAVEYTGSLWVVLGQGELGAPFTFSALELDPATNRIRTHLDLYTYETVNNPDGDMVDSNPVDIAFGASGEVYLVDAGANAVLKWTRDAGLSVFAVWSDNPVPTSIALDIEGNIYVGFLTGFPFPAQGSRIEKYSSDGQLIETYGGFTAVVDLFHSGEELYAVEFATFGEQGWSANTGRVVRVTPEGPVALAEGLNYPYGVAMDGNNVLHVSLGASNVGAGAGQIIALGEGSTLLGTGESSGEGEVPPPVETPETTSG